jgi:glycosyltransferase involved in cell wall biosynthesis
MIDVLVLGSKEYPFGTNRGDDPIPSGGMETYVGDLAPALSKRCRLIIVTRRFSASPVREVKGNIEVRRVRWMKGRWLRNPSFNLFSALSSARMARSVDIIYSNGIVSGLVGLMLARLCGKKCVYRPAGIAHLQQRFPVRQALLIAEKAVMAKSDAVVFHSEGEKRNAQSVFGLPLRSGRVILTGFPVEKFAAAGKKRENCACVTGTVARFVAVKGIEVLIEAFAFAGGKGRLILVGAGPEEGKLRELAVRLGISGSVEFTGFRHDIPQVLAGMDVFVISSFSEGLPTSLLEAMASGCACIVTDIGLPVRDNENGLVVRAGDAKALSSALKTLWGDAALRKRLGEKARRFTLENCTQELAAENHEKVFMSLLEAGR